MSHCLLASSGGPGCIGLPGGGISYEKTMLLHPMHQRILTRKRNKFIRGTSCIWPLHEAITLRCTFCKQVFLARRRTMLNLDHRPTGRLKAEAYAPSYSKATRADINGGKRPRRTLQPPQSYAMYAFRTHSRNLVSHEWGAAFLATWSDSLDNQRNGESP